MNAIADRLRTKIVEAGLEAYADLIVSKLASGIGLRTRLPLASDFEVVASRFGGEPDVPASFMGGPRWPSLRQAFRVAHGAGGTLVASDGLSDPFDDAEDVSSSPNGFELEVYGSTTDPLGKVAGSWLFNMVWNAAQLCADNGQVASLLDEMGIISTELFVAMPKEHEARFVNADGRIGVLFGLPTRAIPDSLEGPLSNIRLVSVQLLTLEELDFVVKNGGDGRSELARRFAAANIEGSSLTRRSLV